MADGSIRIDVDVLAENAKQTLEELRSKFDQTGGSADKLATDDLDRLDNAIRQANTEAERLTATIARMKAGLQFLDGEERVGEIQSIQQMEAELSKVQRTEQQLSKQSEYNATQQAHMTNETKNTSRAMKNVSKESSNVSKSIGGGVKKLGRYALALFSIRSLYTGISRLARGFLQSNSEAGKQAQAQLQYISSVLQSTIAPVITTILNMVATLMGYLASLLKTFFGIEISTAKTKKNIGSGTDAIKKQNKELKKQVAGFDEVNVLSKDTADNQGGGGGGGTPPVFAPSINTDLFEKSLAKLKELFEPFLTTMKNIDFEPLLDSLRQLGEAFKETLSIIGTSIVNMVNNTLAPFIELMAEEILPRFFLALKDIVLALNPLLEFMLTELVEPLFHWFMLDFVPAGMEIIISTLELLKPLIDIVRQAFERVWNDTWKPLFSWLGDKAVKVLENINDLIGIMTGELEENDDSWVDTLATVMRFVTYALVLTTTIKLIGKALGLVTGALAIISTAWVNFKAILGAVRLTVLLMTTSLAGIVTIVAVLVTALVGLGTNWREIVADMKDIGRDLLGFFTGIVEFLKGVFTLDWKRAWSGLVLAFRSIISGIANIFKLPINIVIDGLNSFIRGINRIQIPNWVPGVGGRGINIGQMPRLARGAIVNSPTIAQVGEQGTEAVIPLENNTQGLQMLADLLDDRMGGGSSQNINLVVDGRTLATVVNKQNNKLDLATNGGYKL